MRFLTALGVLLVLAGMAVMVAESVSYLASTADGNGAGDGGTKAAADGRTRGAPWTSLLGVLAFVGGVILVVIGARRSLS